MKINKTVNSVLVCPELSNDEFIVMQLPVMSWAIRMIVFTKEVYTKDSKCFHITYDYTEDYFSDSLSKVRMKCIEAINNEAIRLGLSKFKVGSRVTRKKVNAFRYSSGDGTIVEFRHGRAYIKWDAINKTGQQHSTINLRFLELSSNN